MIGGDVITCCDRPLLTVDHHIEFWPVKLTREICERKNPHSIQAAISKVRLSNGGFTIQRRENRCVISRQSCRGIIQRKVRSKMLVLESNDPIVRDQIHVGSSPTLTTYGQWNVGIAPDPHNVDDGVAIHVEVAGGSPTTILQE